MHFKQRQRAHLSKKITTSLLVSTLIIVFHSHLARSGVPALAKSPSSTDSSKVGTEVDTLDQNSRSSIRYGLSAIVTGTSNDQVPFWMRSNRYGNVPLEGASIGLSGRFAKDYSISKKKSLLDWGTGFEARVNSGKVTEVILIEAYAKGRLGIFQLKAGRSHDITGLVDSTLSSGAFAISGNSLGIPKAELSIPEFYSVPFLWDVIAFKGNFAHGWLGNVDTRGAVGKTRVKTYFHQKSLYARFGRPNWKVKLLAGFNHQVFWGNEKQINGVKYKLSAWETYRRVIFGESYGGDDVGLPRSKVGNHLGSIDQGIEVDTRNLKFFGYHQFFYEVGGLYHLSNIKDGLFGLSILNKKFSSSASKVRWKKVLFEYIATKSQGGEIDAKITPSGDEDYYNNYIYVKGWSYNGANLGNPLVTSRVYARKDLPMASLDYFVNNRLKAVQIGTECAIDSWNFLLRANYSFNYGTYGTSPWGRSLNYLRIPAKPPYFTEKTQFSGILTANRQLQHKINVGMELAVDRGSLLNNSIGLSVKVSKTW